jgi:hypothetical protein
MRGCCLTGRETRKRKADSTKTRYACNALTWNSVQRYRDRKVSYSPRIRELLASTWRRTSADGRFFKQGRREGGLYSFGFQKAIKTLVLAVFIFSPIQKSKDSIRMGTSTSTFTLWPFLLRNDCSPVIASKKWVPWRVPYWFPCPKLACLCLRSKGCLADKRRCNSDVGFLVLKIQWPMAALPEDRSLTLGNLPHSSIF